ncbi:MAG: magnesium transporter [Verrucomicrobiae bacterium]|nr:magnesium transporter [Verrucomicrobiae bacterium]
MTSASPSPSDAQHPVLPETILAALRAEDREVLVDICRQAHPGDIEAAFEQLGEEERETFLHALPIGVLTELTDYLPAAAIERRVRSLSQDERREVLESMSDDELVDLLQEVSDEERPELIELLPEDMREISADLLQFDEHTAGGRMTTAIAKIRASMTIREALAQLKEQQEETEILSRIYVVDNEGRLLGKIRLRDLAFNPRSANVEEFMDGDQIAIQAIADQEEAAQMIARYDMLALPVVDSEFHLLGVITHDDALDILEEEHTEDIERASGIAGDRGDFAYLQTPVTTHLRRRFFWVLGLAFMSLFSGFVMHRYESVFTAHFILALYLPMVVAAGGNTGAQAATMVIRSMSLGELAPRSFWRVIWKEMRIGLMLGGLLGICIALQIQFFLPKGLFGIDSNASLLHLAGVVALALTVQVTSSTFLGAALPLGAKAFRLDPAVVASPAITSFVDVTGMFIYFTLARWLLAF